MFLFQGDKNRQVNGAPEHWGMADLAGVPFVGHDVPLMRESEYEQHTQRVVNVKFGTFDTSHPEQVIMGRRYRDVLEGISIDWMKLLHREHMKTDDKNEDGSPKMFVYIEWAEPVDVLKKNSSLSSNGAQDVSNPNPATTQKTF